MPPKDPRVDVARPKVALIGRPNVGKSTLYNRLAGLTARAGGRAAIVDELPGITRDRLYDTCEWDGYEFTVVDSGGIGPESEDPLRLGVAENSRIAMKEANVIVFVVDGRVGITLSDEAVLKELRRLKKPVIVAVNKVDSIKQEPDATEFWGLGYEDLVFIAAQSGRNTGELLDLIVSRIDWTDYPQATPAYIKYRYGMVDAQGVPFETKERTAQPHQPKFDTGAAEMIGDKPDAGDDGPDAEGNYPFAWAGLPEARFVPDESWRNTPTRLVFVGRQNVGKSSLTNTLLGETRALVADLPGTTRDPLFATFERDGHMFELLDTAGMKRITRLKEDVDYYSLIRAESSLEGSEVGLLVLDAEVGITEQDKRVASKIEDLRRAIVIVVNKADLIRMPEETESELLLRKYEVEPTPRQARQIDRREAARRSGKGKVDPGLKEIYLQYVREGLGKLRWAEVVFTSATEGWGIDEMLAAAERARENFHRRIDNKSLQAVLKEAVTLAPPPVVKNRDLRFFDFRQIGNCPPAFLIELNDKLLIRQAYRRYLERQIRRHFDFAGTHIELVIYEKKRKKRK
jgi:GTP-binding protein